MRSVSRFALLFLLAALPAGAQIDTARLNMRPLIQLHAEGADFTGKPFQTDVFIYQGGYTLLAYSAETGNAARVARAVASKAQVDALTRTLNRAHVGQLRGGCGGPAPDFVATYGLTWYGKQQVKTLSAGGNYTDCPADVRRVFDATCEFIWSALGPSPQICVPANS
jgi:hypothetical protein